MGQLPDNRFWERHYNDPFAARLYLEEELWPHGPVCPRHKTRDRVRRLTLTTGTRTRDDPFGTYKCYRCDYKFDVTVGTIFEGSHTPLHLWLRARVLLGDNPCLAPADLARQLGVSRFVAERMIRLIASVGDQGVIAKPPARTHASVPCTPESAQ